MNRLGWLERLMHVHRTPVSLYVVVWGSWRLGSWLRWSVSDMAGRYVNLNQRTVPCRPSWTIGFGSARSFQVMVGTKRDMTQSAFLHSNCFSFPLVLQFVNLKLIPHRFSSSLNRRCFGEVYKDQRPWLSSIDLRNLCAKVYTIHDW